MYDEWPKMKRDARQKSSPFLSLFFTKGMHFCRASVFILGHLLYVTALKKNLLLELVGF